MILELGHDRGYLVSSPNGPFRWNRRFASLPWRAPVGVVSPGYYGVLDEFPIWNAIFNLYRRDKLFGAAELMQHAGIGTYGDYAIPGDIVWLEAHTSETSEIVRLNDHLEVETLPAELGEREQEVLDFSSRCYDEVSRLFGDRFPPIDTLVTFLAAGSEIPTALWKDGYVAPKADYGKICLPPFESQERTEDHLKRGLVYWFAFALSEGLAAAWLLESATVVLGHPSSRGIALPGFREIEAALVHPADPSEVDAVKLFERARDHAQAIGSRLLAKGGMEGLIHCLTSHRGGGGLASTDRAIRAAYGVHPDDVFLG